MFSVIIPMYNSEKSIIKCLQSVVNQSKPFLIKEIIVVDDGSEDKSVELIKKWIEFERVTLNIKIISAPNSGVSNARNKGINVSQGKWIAFLDSDDVWKRNKLELQEKTLLSYPNIVFLGGNRDFELLRYGYKFEKDLYLLNAKLMLLKAWPHTSTIVVKKEILEEFGCFDSNRSYCEDIQLWMKIAHKYGAYYLYESLEFFGDGKLSFGVSGLSANLKMMHNGMLLNFKDAYSLRYINVFDYYFLIMWEQIKYFRRIIMKILRIKKKV